MKLGELLAHAGRAAFWGALSKWFDIAGSMLTFLLMVRLLSPEQFGVWGLALLVTLIPETIIGGALSESLIQREDLSPSHTSSVALLQTALAVVMGAAILSASPWISAALGHNELQGLVSLLALSLPLIAISAAPAALLLRELSFRKIAAVDAAGTVTAAIVGLAAVFAGLGVWSLAWMELARRAARALGFLLLGGWPMVAPFSLARLSEVLRYGGAVLTSRLLQQSDMAIPRFFLGLVSAASLGYFNLAQRMFQQSSQVFIAPFTGMAMPLASRLRRHPEELANAIEGAIRIATLVSYPVFLGAAAVAPIAVPLFLGDAWTPAIVPIQLMLLLGVRAASASLNGSVLRAVGRPGAYLLLVGASVALVAILSPLVAAWGASAMAAMLLLRGVATWVLGARLLEQATTYPALRQLTAGWQGMAAALFMAAIVYAAQAGLRDVVAPWALLPTLVVAGAGLYVFALQVLAPSMVRQLLAFGGAVARREKPDLSARAEAWVQAP